MRVEGKKKIKREGESWGKKETYEGYSLLSNDDHVVICAYKINPKSEELVSDRDLFIRQFE